MDNSFDSLNHLRERKEREIKHMESTARDTLEKMNYSYNGAELWKPPLGKKPAFDEKPVFTQAMMRDSLALALLVLMIGRFN